MEYYTIRGLYLGASLVYIVSQCSVSFHLCLHLCAQRGASSYRRGGSEHLFWIHTQWSPPPDFGLSD